VLGYGNGLDTGELQVLDAVGCYIMLGGAAYLDVLMTLMATQVLYQPATATLMTDYYTRHETCQQQPRSTT